MLREPGEAALLSADERARWEGFRSQKRRDEFVRGRTLLRRAVRAMRGAADDPVPLQPLPAGGLMLPENDLALSLTHSGALAAVALAPPGRALGLDVERRRPVGEALGRRLLHSGEHLPRTDAAVLTAWTAKEAVLKAVGQGLRTRMETVFLDWHDAGQEARAHVGEAVLRVRVRKDDEYLWALACSETAP